MKRAGKSRFDQAVIDFVRMMREARGYSQDGITVFLNTMAGYIDQVESPASSSKYNLNHLSQLGTNVFKLKNDLPDDSGEIPLPLLRRDWMAAARQLLQETNWTI